MNWKHQFLESINGIKGFEKTAFIDAHESTPPVSIRLNPYKPFEVDKVFANPGVLGPVPWCQNGYYLKSRPVFTLEPLLHAGAFYVQEASSMFIDHALRTVLSGRKGLTALDLCAAPGGKTTLLASLPYFDTLLANEIIQSRVSVLMENLAKWGSHHVLVSNNDPEVVGRLGAQFDLVLVDAPCSGSGLFRKDENAMDEWSPAAVEMCAARQKRILHHAMSLVKEGGYLLYSTCSYSIAENEANADYILDSGDFETVSVNPEKGWGIVETISPVHQARGYRFYPDKLSGEGFFCSMFRKTSGNIDLPKYTISKPIAESSIGKKWIEDDPDIDFLFRENTLYMLNKPSMSYLSDWSAKLKLRKTGLKMGTIIRGELIPDHELSMSSKINNDLPDFDVSKLDAIRYLRKDDIDARGMDNGWRLIKYLGHPLGWAKFVNGRLKNHYPLSWRILMDPHKF
jgi:16S rRNA C967 or C1407 C5-methylase (RsmB/RsmF family)/NOL1/NOP2/fmu family ribosome biogenesis protein